MDCSFGFESELGARGGFAPEDCDCSFGFESELGAGGGFAPEFADGEFEFFVSPPPDGGELDFAFEGGAPPDPPLLPEPLLGDGAGVLPLFGGGGDAPPLFGPLPDRPAGEGALVLFGDF